MAKSYSWNLGICVPTVLLGIDGYLPKRQTNLESLSLITDNSYSADINGMSYMNLSFPRLECFSWQGAQYQGAQYQGAQSETDHLVLWDFLQANRSTLKSIVMEAMDCFKLKIEATELSHSRNLRSDE